MKYSKSDLSEILVADGALGNLLELLRDFEQYKTEYCGDLIKIEGYTKFDEEVYLVYMNTKLIDDEPVYYITIDSVSAKLSYREYVFLSNYIIKCSEVKNLVDYTDEIEKKKSFWQRIFGE